jgi:D-alanyl-D-alanine carboxypeptidase/D-alanyl-D-alanine-endopeptidase (penicillin-binding protein 4)
VKRSLSALIALLAAGLTLLLPGQGTRVASDASGPLVETVSAVPGTHLSPGPQGTKRGGSSLRWERRLRKLTSGPPISVAVSTSGVGLFRSRPATMRVPASNEKLVLSMAILDALGPGHRIETRASAVRISHGVVRGNLWLEGAGDPTITSSDLARLAHRIRAEGIRRITGSVLGSVEPFAHDWNAPGWKRRFRREEVGIPTALTFDRNTIRGKHVRHPERFAAASLLQHLRKEHVAVGRKAGAGRPPADVREIATIESPWLLRILREQNVDSVNFLAEVLNKLLGYGSPTKTGSIAAGGAAIESWAATHGVELEAHDGSGLSYANRVSAAGIVDLLQASEAQSWGTRLRDSLPHPGQGTLRGRLAGVKLHAKTGTLHIASALSGWVWLQREDAWAAFSILVGNTDTSRAVDLEDEIVRILSRSARIPVD